MSLISWTLLLLSVSLSRPALSQADLACARIDPLAILHMSRGTHEKRQLAVERGRVQAGDAQADQAHRAALPVAAHQAGRLVGDLLGAVDGVRQGVIARDGGPLRVAQLDAHAGG